MSQSDNLTEAELRRRLAEAEAALAALRSGKADTLIGDAGPLLFQLKSAVEVQMQAQEALQAALKRSQRQQEAVATLAVSPAIVAGDLASAVEQITELAARVMGVERMGVWLFDQQGDELRCVDLYESSLNRHSAGAVLRRHEYQREFDALFTARYVDADDPLTDPRTAGYVDGYLKPLGITSMLDAVISARGRNLGVLCFEHVNQPHHWEPDEIAFACQISDQIALLLLNRERKQAEAALRREHTLVERITSASPAGITVVDRHGQITFANPQAEKILGLTKEAITQRTYNAPAWRITALDGGPFPDEELPFRRVMATRKPVTDIRHAIEWPDGRRVLLSINGAPLLDASGELEGAVFTVSDITEQLQAEALLACQTKVLELIATGASLATTLTRLIQEVEALHPGLLGSVLLLDKDGVHLRHGAAPSLPEAYNRAIDGLVIGPNVGSCGTAVFRGEAVVVEDIATDPLWKDYRELAMAHGLRACWSTPIFDEQRRVLGTFAIYYRKPGRPAPEHLRWVEMATHLAAVAIQKLREEAALRESERRLATLMANLPGMAYRCANQPQWPMEFVSEGCAGLTGWSASALLQNRPAFGELIVEADRQFVWDTVQRALAARRPYELTYRIRTADGQLRWVWERGCGVFAPDGSLLFLEGFITDITERKQAEDRIRRLAAFPELNPNPVLEFAADGSLTYHNPAAQELVRRSGARDLQEIMPPNSDQIIRECLASGRPCLRLEVRCGERTISWSFYPIEQLGVVHAYAGDITERKQAEVAQARLATAIEQAAEAVVITDTQGTIQYVNPAFEKVTGYSREEAIGRNLRFLKSGKHDTEFYQRLWAVLTRGEVWRGHFVNKRKDGTLYEEEATISPVRDAAGRIIHYVAVKRDVTHETQLEAQLLQAQKMEAIGRLAGGVAHDFNNILAVILMQTEFLLMSVDLSEGVRDGVQQVRTAAERAANLTRQLLLFSRRQVMQARDLDLNEVVTNLAKMLQRIIGEDVRLELHLHPTPLMTHADAGMLDQVLMNLAVNTRDAMPKGGRLIIETTAREFSPEEAAALPDVKPGHYVGLRVSDTGCGIPPEILPRIFEPFFTTKEQGKGTGLGLATVFGIVKQHGGSIQVASEPGRGTTFEVYIPALPAGSTQATAAESRTPPRGGTETILLVEDEPDVRQVTRVILEVHGYRVLEASDGRQALELWQQHRETIQLLFTDMVMPEGMSGRELSQRLRADRPQLKVLYTSGYSAELAGQELPPGASFLQKPCSAELLLETVRRCLDAPSEAPLI